MYILWVLLYNYRPIKKFSTRLKFSDPLSKPYLSGTVLGILRLHDRNDESFKSAWLAPYVFGDAQIFPKKSRDRMGLRSERRGNRAESYGDVVRHGRLPKTLAESDETVMMGNISVKKPRIVNTDLCEVTF